MARTDVHRPWRVQITDPHNRHILYRYPAWPDGVELTSFRNIGCGCKLCTGQLGRKTARRRERSAWRNAARRILADPRRVDIDVPPLRCNAW